jgi:hypothetical protein
VFEKDGRYQVGKNAGGDFSIGTVVGNQMFGSKSSVV